jgi:hypothetical protein
MTRRNPANNYVITRGGYNVAGCCGMGSRFIGFCSATGSRWLWEIVIKDMGGTDDVRRLDPFSPMAMAVLN